jgi:hypothetical protein
MIFFFNGNGCIMYGTMAILAAAFKWQRVPAVYYHIVTSSLVFTSK